MSRIPEPKNRYVPNSPLEAAPRYLSQKSKQLYTRLAPQLKEICSILDTNTLAQYCSCYTRWQECEKNIIENGLIIDGKPNPVYKISMELLRQCKIMADNLGLSPVGRSKISALPEVDEEEFLLPQTYEQR